MKFAQLNELLAKYQLRYDDTTQKFSLPRNFDGFVACADLTKLIIEIIHMKTRE